MAIERFRHQDNSHHRWQSCKRRECGTEVVPRQAKLAGVVRQATVLVRSMPDRMHPRPELGEDEGNNEKEMAQRIHGVKFRQLR